METFIVALHVLFISFVHANVIPSTPTSPLVRRLDSDTVGYYQVSSTWAVATCDIGYYWQVSSTFGGCCPAGQTCAPYTSCHSNYLVGRSSSYLCPSSASECVTDYLFESFGDPYPTLWIGCNDGAVNLFVTPPTVAASTTSTFLTSSSTPTIPSTTTTSSSTTTTPPPAATTTIPPKPTSSSKAWIAGVVIGPIVLIAIAALLFWILRLKHLNNQPPTQSQYSQSLTTAPQMAQPPPQAPMSPSPLSPAPAYAEYHPGEPMQNWGQDGGRENGAWGAAAYVLGKKSGGLDGDIAELENAQSAAGPRGRLAEFGEDESGRRGGGWTN